MSMGGMGASGAHPREHAALAGSSADPAMQGDTWQSFMAGKGLSASNPLVLAALGGGLGLLKGSQKGGGGLGAALGAGIGGATQGLLTSHMMKQQAADDERFNGLLGALGGAPGQQGAPPVAGNPPQPSGVQGAAPQPELMPRTNGMGDMGSNPELGGQRGMMQPPPMPSPTMPPPMGTPPPRPMGPPPGGMGGPPPPVPMSRPMQMPMPGMGGPPPSGVGGMMLDSHMKNPGLGGPQMPQPGAPPGPPMAGGPGPMAGIMPAGGMQGMGNIGLNLANLPPELRTRMMQMQGGGMMPGRFGSMF
jgi:hypothetical protein